MGLAGPWSRVLAFGSRVPDFDVIAITDIVCFLASAINESDTMCIVIDNTRNSVAWRFKSKTLLYQYMGYKCNFKSDFLFCQNNPLHRSTCSAPKSENSKVNATVVKPKRAIYVRDPTMWVLFDEKIVMSPPSGETYCFCLVRLSVWLSVRLSVCQTSFPLNNSSTLLAFKLHRVIALIA